MAVKETPTEDTNAIAFILTMEATSPTTNEQRAIIFPLCLMVSTILVSIVDYKESWPANANSGKNSTNKEITSNKIFSLFSLDFDNDIIFMIFI